MWPLWLRGSEGMERRQVRDTELDDRRAEWPTPAPNFYVSMFLCCREVRDNKGKLCSCHEFVSNVVYWLCEQLLE